jgi:predicted esterase
MPDRRAFLSSLAMGVVAAACGSDAATAPTAPAFTAFDEPARLRLNPRKPTQKAFVGSAAIWYDTDRLSYLRVPPTYHPSEALPLVIAFHGGGGRGTFWMGDYGDRTDAARMILLAPESATLSWDGVEGRFGIDIEMLNNVLDQVFDRVYVDPSRIALAGFSDGASYALSLGLSNGDNIRHVVAHTPGFYVDVPRHGHPDFFVSHGTNDGAFYIEETSDVIVPLLRGYGDDVQYSRFDGAHEIPPGVAAQAVDWLSSAFKR